MTNNISIEKLEKPIDSKSDQERVVMCRSREEEYLEFETARNEAMDKYFKARQGLTRSQTQEDIFGGGFRMAWQIYNETQGKKLVSEKAIRYLNDQWPTAYIEFCKRL